MDNSEKDESTGFKVIDKRRFTTDSTSPEVGPRQVVSESETVQSKQVVGNQSEIEKINFSSFILGMYTHTLIFLGDIPHPETNIVTQNMEAAKQNIDILNILEEKTKGNLTNDESLLMKEVLDNLRVQFINKVKK